MVEEEAHCAELASYLKAGQLLQIEEKRQDSMGLLHGEGRVEQLHGKRLIVHFLA